MTGNKSFQNFFFSVGGIAAMFLLLAGVYIISHLAAARFDLTEERMYTLSDGTKAILKKLDTPVNIHFYATQGKDMPVELKTYAQRVEDLLNEYKKYGGSKIRIKKFDPEPLSDAEDSAAIDGVQGQQINFGDKIYLGLSIGMLDQKVALPFLDPGRERLLEYDISRAIANVITTEKPVIGVMSSLPIFGQFNPMMMQRGGGQQDPWIFISELKNEFTVEEIQSTASEIDDKIKILMVVHPKNLTDQTLYAIDQFIMRGGKVIAFLDPMSFVDAQNAPQNNPLQGAMNASSSMDKLTKAWGVEFDSSKVVADLTYASQMNRGGRAVSAPAVLSLTDQAVNTNDIVTSQIDSLVVAYSGVLTGTAAEGLTRSVLLHTSTASQLVEKFMAQFGDEQITKDFAPSGQQYPLAIRLTGKFKTAFPDGQPSDPGNTNQPPAAAGGLKESKETSVVVIADSDMLFDQLVARVQNFFGQRLIMPLNGNLNFVQSLVEQYAGDENLIGIRSRATMNRPFTRVREMQVAAEERYRGKIKDLQASLQETQNEINSLQTTNQPGQRIILSPEQQAAIERFREKEASVRKELKQVEKDLRRDIDSLENRLKVYNIFAMPFLVTAAGLSLAFVKRKKTAAK